MEGAPRLPSLRSVVTRGNGQWVDFPHWRGEWSPYTSYLFGVAGGADEVLSLGKEIADGAAGSFAPAARGGRTPGQVESH